MSRRPGRSTQRAEVLAHHGPGGYEDWHPCLPGSRVRVTLSVDLADLRAHVSIWGADDTGVERECDLAEGLDLYARIAPRTCPPRASLLGPRWRFRPA